MGNKDDSVMAVPQGYRFASVAAGFKYKNRHDLGVIVSDTDAVAAAVFTTNRFQAAPVLVGRELIDSGKPLRAVMVNAGYANACTGDLGIANCRESMRIAADVFGLAAEEVFPMSTGVIGPQFDMNVWREGLSRLGIRVGDMGPVDVAKAIMTTDSFPKLAWAEVMDEDGHVVRILGMAKGAGMISPNMATMLATVICDAEVDPDWWQKTISACADKSFNCVTVDGDTSTNDTLVALANGASGIRFTDPAGQEALYAAVKEVCQALAYMIVEDAEGGTKIIRVRVEGATSNRDAEKAARTIGNSPLVKTAIFGADPNWGRIVAALGRCGADFDPSEVSVKIGGIPVFENGTPVDVDLDSLLAPHMRRQEIKIDCVIGQGSGRYMLLASDLTHDYIRINADYRS
ncbi:bifunctional glutamate N-acetyltransferase/amino-acid acetyltransferase ArgJ [Desulfovibrio inopinatus]|uniref:bifunctional glutamate N-acetyltransferase/amino-acid acetyltransferase ArgJ n=1 Tax=Desulfovibrio inopinatus TaxID=102109 RepID=UPI00042702C4|nr:bifunctional glutamate N-acetyltransferase/amino-acid acetyltransferase ArgJ [Desulfovibrio inopinatus]